eukprot:TRINITY_DN42200_c0_g2_i1.p1 TRINITY_DN42200_c0_g2~~TRINITY_DN42200_c0_g2_i1.p1  ORF type:complete len:597 (-),score=46.07 TRINITY_DN42200_c0_g2_i1:312-2102(-)
MGGGASTKRKDPPQQAAFQNSTLLEHPLQAVVAVKEEFSVNNSQTLSPVQHLPIWLLVSPPAESPVHKTLERCFPGSLPGQFVLDIVVSTTRELGVTSENTIYGQSTCPDEINNEDGDLTSLMQGHFGACFPMGGIGGAPFVGKTGFMAFSNHAPTDGNVLVLFGPHIAISESGELGKYLRRGQAKHSGACGAVLAAYESCKACTAEKGHTDDPLDTQQCWLRNQISRQFGDIQKADEPLAALIQHAYEAVREKLLAVVNTKFGSGKLILVGGIQINMPEPYADRFQPLLFQVQSANTEPIDLLDKFRFEQPFAPTSALKSGSSSVAIEKFNNKMFTWLEWAPPYDSECFATLHEAFPGAMPGHALMLRATGVLKSLGIRSDNTLYGQSICPDEINNEPGDLASIMRAYFGNCFPMGGIGGAPYCGKTGFGAFSSHVYDGGHIVILFGPHIAISESGELGQYLRTGQSKHSTACGAVLAAYDSCCKAADSGSAGEDEHDPLDMQQCWLRQQIGRQLDTIRSSKTPIAALVHESYEAIKEKLLSITHTNFGSGYLVLIGGIQINMPTPWQDHFQPLMFQVESKDSASADLLSTLQTQ